MSTKATPLLIVGAGPTGLTLGCELLRHGVPCRLIERDVEASPFSKALAVHARTLELFEHLGIADRVVALGQPLSAFNVFDRKKHTVRMTFGELDSRYPYVLSLPQSDTERVLAEDFEARGGVIEREVSLEGLTQGVDGVTASLRHADGHTEEYTCPWLAGCDGSHSSVRHALGLPFEGAKYPEYYVLADVEFETTLDTTEFYIFSDGDKLAGFHTFSPVGARIFADIELPPSEREKPQVTLEQLQANIDSRGPGNIRLTKLNWLSTFFCHMRQTQTYRAGRVFLAGDSAHVHSPAGGQGMNMGIQDAFNLAWKLALVERGLSPDSLLDSYTPERHDLGKSILRMTDFFQRINTMHNPLLQEIRGSLGPVLSRNEIIRHRYRRAVAGLSQHYRKSPAVAASPGRHGGPHAGERAPDGILFDPVRQASVRLFELLREPTHHLVLFAATSGDAPEFHAVTSLVREKYSGMINEILVSPGGAGTTHFVDADLALHRLYHAQRPAFFLIRPDGYIGYAGTPVQMEHFARYLKTLFY